MIVLLHGERSLLEGLAKQLGPVPDGSNQHAQVNKVERLDEIPLFFQVVDEELEVCRDANDYERSMTGQRYGSVGEAHKSGWMGLKSMPITYSQLDSSS